MGNNKSAEQREEVVVNQNNLGGSVSSVQLDQLQRQTGATNYFYLAISLLLLFGALIIIYRWYKKCTKSMLQRHMNEYEMQRSASFFRRFRSRAGGDPKAENV